MIKIIFYNKTHNYIEIIFIFGQCLEYKTEFYYIIITKISILINYY